MDTFLTGVLEEIFLHGLLDTLKVIPFLFLTYLLMEWLEHKENSKIISSLKKSGKAGPVLGGALGCIPQCGFGATGSSLFSARIISIGTLVAIFLSTSDEMLPVLISGRLGFLEILVIVLYKAAVGMLVGLLFDFIIRFFKKEDNEAHIHKLCQDENCHCEDGILKSSIHHTVKIGAFLLIVTLLINTIVFFLGVEVLKNSVFSIPFVGHLLTALIGLIPNCAVSVALADFYVEGIISAGTMLSGLFSGAGVGLLVLLRTNKNLKENVVIASVLAVSGVLFGMLFDVLPFDAFFGK
jgi:hypothetical protein